MKRKRFPAFQRGFNLLIIFFSSPLITIRLITWKRINNAFKAIFLKQGNIEILFHRYKAMYNASPILELDILNDGFCNDGKDIIFFPAIDWGFRFQRPQHLARELGKIGYRIFYISTVPLIFSNRTGYLVQAMPEPGVILIQLSSGSFRVPDFYKDEWTEEERSGLLKSYKNLCQDFNIGSPILLIQQPFWWPIISSLNGRKVIYDCLDHHAGFSDQPNHNVIESERKLIKDADQIIVTSEVLADSFRSKRDCHVIRNGCEFNRFNQVTRSRPRLRLTIGYVGAVSDWFDGQLLFDVAREQPAWRFDIYGATVGADIAAARTLPNVNFFGEISYETVPDVIANFDVCIIPFKLNLLTLATNPVKVYEYLAVGRPVVATNMPELSGLDDLDVFCSDSACEFIQNIEHAISIADLPDRIKVRKDWASQNDWSKRANAINSLIQEH